MSIRGKFRCNHSTKWKDIVSRPKFVAPRTFTFTFTFGEDSMLSSAEAVITFGPMRKSLHVHSWLIYWLIAGMVCMCWNTARQFTLRWKMSTSSRRRGLSCTCPPTWWKDACTTSSVTSRPWTVMAPTASLVFVDIRLLLATFHSRSMPTVGNVAECFLLCNNNKICHGW